jgi:FMN phosphatase YigB (HAD superfamily)
MYKPNQQSDAVPKITKFGELPEIKNGLYVFDIDETLLVFKEVSDVWWKRNFEKIYAETDDIVYASNKMSKIFVDIVKTHKPAPTDIEGFKRIEADLDINNNTLIFLTARPESLEVETYRQIADLNLKYSYPIYFSGEKGLKMKWILSNISSDNNFDSIIFVDDKIYNIEDVQKECPQVQCFQFIPDDYIAKANSKSSANATPGFEFVADSSPK